MSPINKVKRYLAGCEPIPPEPGTEQRHDVFVGKRKPRRKNIELELPPAQAAMLDQLSKNKDGRKLIDQLAKGGYQLIKLHLGNH